MKQSDQIRQSKFLSLVLRHQPEKVGITLDAAGWVLIADLLAALERHGRPMTRQTLQHLIDTSEKKRFALSDDGQRIRASQGHSVEVELGYEPSTPPALLYHGTVDRFVDSIRQKGLIKGERHHVHLSPDPTTAASVGARRGKPVILTIDAEAMAGEGLLFYLSANGVWLTDHVPARFITFPSSQ